MGEGVTNPTDSAVEGPSVLYAACLKLVLLLSLSYVVVLRWRKHRRELENSDATCQEDNTTSLRGEKPSTSLTGNTGPHLRRSEHCGIVSHLPPSVVDVMEQNTDAPSEPQPDSFFTWDSGGNSGDYSFVHTAVELPKYPDGAISEEERQMLLLYMQSGHPELLLGAPTGSMDNSHPLLGPPLAAESVICDQASVRGYLETIVEENSDDLRSPSDCDEASVGWGSWDESDDDRNTVVEMETSDQNLQYVGIKRELEEQSISSPKATKREKPASSPGYNSPSDTVRQNVIYAAENQLGGYDLTDKQTISLPGAPSVNNCAFENCAVDGVSSINNTKFSDVIEKRKNMSDTNPQVSENSDFDTLWITANNLNSPLSETANPWCKTGSNSIPIDIDSVDIETNNHSLSTENNLLTFSSDDICLVPSGKSSSVARKNEEKLMFSDDFKDYFLPTENCVPSFNKIANNPVEPELEKLPLDKIKCFRIGFESEPLEIINNEYHNSRESPVSSNSPTDNCENNDLKQETLFSPRDGDVVYGSSWLGGHSTKKPEKTLTSAEALFSAMHSESPPSDINRKSLHLFDQSASDDELQQVPNSLSRWQHHSDLQHVQEATSPITRWQHQSDLQLSGSERFPKENNYSDEDSDDGLPPQLKQIYSSFKMKGKKGRIRIKDDKSNNFKKLGLWDNDSKVTLPPFITNSTINATNNSINNKDCVKEEELDDLELDMFSVNKNKLDKSQPQGNNDQDIDDALKSFNHLDDYTSNSDENSESENSYTVNTVENIDYDNEDLSNPSTPDMPSLKNDSCINEHLKSENDNTCSDNSDNCPLCTDPSFKKSKITDIFSIPTESNFLDNNVQSLLLNTYPKIKSLSPDDSISNRRGPDSTATPQTSSDSDESIRAANTKKRTKRRNKDSSIELKHDDSGYVEDDEDDDEDVSLEEKDSSNSEKALSSISALKDSSKVRKSLSTAFYESKSMSDTLVNKETIPNSFEEFSSQLQQSSISEDVNDGIINKEKWDIPDNISQFSAWLLDKELKKISCRDKMEKLIVNDILSLKEQTIAQFLKNSVVSDQCDILATKNSDDSESILTIKSTIPDTDISQNSKVEFNSNSIESECKSQNMVEEALEGSSDNDKTTSDDSEDRVEHSSEELDSEYYSYNLNPNVNKISEFSDELVSSNTNAENKTSPSNNTPVVISEEKEIFNTKLENKIEDITDYEHSLLKIEDVVIIEETQNAKSEVCFDRNTQLNDASGVPTSANSETVEYGKQKQTSELPSDVGETEEEKRVKVIPTTTFLTSEEELATSDVVSDSVTESAPINNKYEEDCELAPSVDGSLNYEIIEDTNRDSDLKEEKLEVGDSLELSNLYNDNLNENTEQFPNDENISLKFNNDAEKCVQMLEDFVRAEEIVPNGEIFVNMPDIINCIPAPVEFSSLSQEVAPSSDSAANETATVGGEIDLMIPDQSEAKGANQGFSNDIISLEAKAASREVDSAKHVTDVDCYAYDELPSRTRPDVNDNSLELPAISVPSGGLSDNGIVDSGPEELRQKTAISPKVPDNSEEFNLVKNTDCVSDSTELKRENFEQQDTTSSSEQVGDYISQNNTEITCDSEFDARDNSLLNSLYKSKSVTVLQTEDFDDEEDIFLDHSAENNFDNSVDRESSNNASSVAPSSSRDNEERNVSKFKSSDDLSLVSNRQKFREIREEFKRSRSVGRETKEESTETWSGQSKSTPDLSRCHDLQLNSSVPLSALLSKRVSERIQDYLGNSSRGGVLSRSLPPNERSRHYRRICVSTETVVERAARFEARSKSGGRENNPAEAAGSRSGSCPPASMRTIEAMKGVRGYGKPTAAVRPTVDIYRSTREGGDKKTEAELFELITGYGQASRVTHKPPVPPQASVQQSLKNFRLKGKIASARKEFFERLSQSDLRPKPDGHRTPSVDAEDEEGPCGLRRFNEFRKSAREERARLAQSHPDLGALEAAVRSSRRRIDHLKKRRQNGPTLDAGPRPSSDEDMPVTTAPTTTKDGTLVLPYRRCTGEIAWASCAKRLEEAKARSHSKSQEPLEIVDERQFKRPAERALLRAHDYENAADEEYGDPGPAIPGSDFSRARSMDFLLDNREGAEPPENRLAQRVKSEHELRIERSLQNLTLPDWYTQSKKPKEGFILRRGSEGSAGESRKRWLGFSSSRTPSATSLTTPPSSYSQRNIIIPKRVTPTSGEWRYIGSLVSSRESLTPASPASLSPRECSSAAFNYGLNASLSRWSSSRLSTSSAPLTSVNVHRSSFRQPYLGWRAAQAASSGGASRSSPGVSPVNATTPLQGSRPGSPRRGSQDHQYGGYGLQQNQITSAATLRPEGDTGDSGSRISPLALYDNSTNVFFNSNIEVPEFTTPEMRRDRYSYTQSLYSGTVIVSPGTEFKPVPSIAEDASSTTDDRFSMSRSPQPPPRIWMESSFVGSKKDGKDQVLYPQGRTIRIVPSDSVRSGDRSGGSSVRSSCAPQTTMGEYVLRDFRRFGITL